MNIPIPDTVKDNVVDAMCDIYNYAGLSGNLIDPTTGVAPISRENFAVRQVLLGCRDRVRDYLVRKAEVEASSSFDLIVNVQPQS